MNLNVNGSIDNVSFREVSDEITVKAFVSQEVSITDTATQTVYYQKVIVE